MRLRRALRLSCCVLFCQRCCQELGQLPPLLLLLLLLILFLLQPERCSDLALGAEKK